ncbi:PAS domain-containing protein [Flaviaesturariibacter flavus]|uniref:histidine kinase n=1 Tax=Flaviaesturariibacter flavus TaxID=2502780 RepID=A0A4R1BMU8_9BACT|nr:ATP-binding protein [Flaviaesturariibacter flavus]TCJ18667.1 PAS domain-containing protein [Flaviaesturariibacter flavus]
MIQHHPGEVFIHQLFDAQPDAVIWFVPVFAREDDPAGEPVDFEAHYCNKKAAEILKSTPEGVVGVRLLDSALIDNESRRHILSQCHQVWETGLSTEFTYYSPSLDRYFNVQRSKVYDGILSITRDRTKEMRLEMERRRQEERYRQVLDTAADGILVFESVRNAKNEIVDFHVVHANRRAYEIGALPQDTVGSTLLQLLPHLERSEQLEWHRRVAETGEPMRFETTFRTPDGSEFGWFLVSLNRLGDGVVSNFVDVTQLKKLQRELEHKVEELRRSNQSLEEFAYAASHDLQEPLRKIHFFADRLKGSIDPQSEQAGMFARMELATTRMRDLIDDLLSYSRLSQAPPATEPLSLGTIVQQALQDLEAAIIESDALVRVDALPEIQGDERQLRQLFQNLLGNALKYRMPGRRPEISVRCRTTTDNENLLIEVEDNGIGFEPEYAERIFQVFQRLHGKMEYEGSGVGLAIARKVVTNHQGVIVAEGRPGEGATFRIYLPLAIRCAS